LTLVTFYEVEIPFSSSLVERTASVQDVKRRGRGLGSCRKATNAGPDSLSASKFSEIGQRQTSTPLTLLRNYSVQSAFLYPQNSLPFWKTAARTADGFVGKIRSHVVGRRSLRRLPLVFIPPSVPSRVYPFIQIPSPWHSSKALLADCRVPCGFSFLFIIDLFPTTRP
jgi:hypothetical protein